MFALSKSVGKPHMAWKALKFANTVGGIQRSTILQKEFGDVMIARRAPQDAAMFARSKPNGREYECYFSPAAVAIFNSTLERWGAQDADAPNRENLSLLVGSAAPAWELLGD